MTRALVAGLVAIFMQACGGKANSDAFDDDTGGSTSDLSVCEEDADCKLRRGLGCCSCSPGDWVAVSLDYEKELCGGSGPIPCNPCELPAPPEDLAAICGADGHCALSTLD